MLTMTPGEKIGGLFIYIVLIVLSVFCLFPLLYVTIMSLTPEAEIVRKGIVIIPDTITLRAYREMLGSSHGLGAAYQVTLFRTIVGTALSLFFTAITAYPLSRKYLPGRSAFLLYIVFTMLFSGGLIPTYLLVRYLGLLNTVWSLIVPGMLSAFNLVIMKGFFEQLPVELEESARVDGSGDMTILMKIIVPLSLPVMATIGLFYAVWHWNSYFDAIMYIHKADQLPLQVVLRNILLNVQAISNDLNNEDQPVGTLALQMAAVVLSTLPILIVYPFIQKHFTKGVLLGSIKG
ncbi:carbohydrate ABC transporter permease [Paenibacillus thalictri]|uniref:Carbohydrate ABC transporter permease n=1 Tax=Paenibacillus thalictri TaxID=2527873 RepID=A0A4Q9DY09_9BACL|nr:carbohydrate ABC transporter permease [Paenibacillus thalictri]TBL80708.1 carbohydrate ABC transporter permease [Paenibacillus thalictri]